MSVSPPPRRKRRESGWDKMPGAPGVPPMAPIMPDPHHAPRGHTTQATQGLVDRRHRRLYIGNLSRETEKAHIGDFINDQLKLVPDRPITDNNKHNAILNIDMKADKGFCFVEFYEPTDSDVVLCMSGMEYSLRPLKISRPKDYMPLPGSAPRSYNVSAIRQGQAPSVSSSDAINNKVYIGGLPIHLTEDNVKELVSSFGALQSFNLVRDKVTGASKGYGFFVYENTSVTDDACATLNGMDIAGRNIVCQRALTPQQRAEREQAAMAEGGPQRMNQGNMPGPPPFQMGVAPPLMGGIPANVSLQPTRILVMQNMVTEDELRDDQEYSEILEDVEEECNKYGRVLSIQIPRPAQAAPVAANIHPDRMPMVPVKPVDGVGKVFVEYASIQDAQAAERAISGRKFADRTIVTTFLTEKAYADRNFS